MKTIIKSSVMIIVLTAFGFSLSMQDKAIKMEYKFAGDTVLKYTVVNTSGQELDVMGNVQEAEGKSEGEISYSSVLNGDKLTHNLTFTALKSSNFSAMTGDVEVSTKPLLNVPLIVETGKRGENLQLSNIKDMPALGEEPFPGTALGLASLIIELPEKPVKINDTWVSFVPIEIDVEDAKLTISSETTFTFAGFEMNNGFNCMKIIGKSKSKLSGDVTIQTMDASMEVDGTGTITGYFAYEKGFWVELISESTGDMTIDITGGGITIDGSIKDSSKITIIK